MRRALPAVIPLLAVMMAGCGSPPPTSELSVILVTLDTTRADRLGAYGYTAVDTPNLDRIASEGVLFENAMSQVPLTLPAHGSILTGMHPAAHGVRHNGIYRLPGEVETLTERLRDAGFETAAFLGAYVLNAGFGTEQGFDTYDDVPVNRFLGGRDQRFEAQRTADEVNERVIEWLDGADRGRKFLWVHYYDPHEPYGPPENGRALQGEGYDREISYLDACVGDLLGRLERDGMLDRSILVVAGDHGESLGEHGERTHGLFLYEEAIHVPLLFRAPGRIGREQRIPGPASLVDIAPTVLDLLELPPLSGAQGRSLAGRIRGEEDGTLELAFGETWMPRLEFGWSELYMVRSHRYKYIQAPTPELYDLFDDPEEAFNLAGSEPDLAGEMAGWLSEWLEGAESGTRDATRELDPEEERRLQALGYLGGDSFREEEGDIAERADPKDVIQEMVRLDEARDLLAKGDAEAALRDATGILRDNPRNYWARVTRITALIELGRLDEAEEEARAGVSLAATDPDRSGPLEVRELGLLASTVRLQGRIDEAEKTYRRILEIDPGNEDVTVDLARMFAETGREQEALDLAASVLDTNPGNGMALAARMWAEIGLGRRDASLSTAAELADAMAGDPPSLVKAGDLLTGAGRPDRAADCYQAAALQQPEDPILLGKLGAALLSSGQHGDARQVFLAVARIRPRDPRAPFYLGEIALAAGDAEEARSRFRQALALDPRFTAPRLSLARWLAASGKVDEARLELLEAIRVNPGDSRARQMLHELSGKSP